MALKTVHLEEWRQVRKHVSPHWNDEDPERHEDGKDVLTRKHFLILENLTMKSAEFYKIPVDAIELAETTA